MIHIGFAETDITPKLGSQSPGGMQARRLNDVHDPLKAVAMVIKGEKATIALVGIDSLFITEETTARAREAIVRETPDSGANVLDRCQPYSWRRSDRQLLRVARLTRRISSSSRTRSREAVGSAIGRCMRRRWATGSATSRASASTAGF